jgi:hypothetical protein
MGYHNNKGNPPQQRGPRDPSRDDDSLPFDDNDDDAIVSEHKVASHTTNRPRARSVDEFTVDEMDLIKGREWIERMQTKLDIAHQDFKQLLDSKSKLATTWAKFESSGGVSSEQLKQFFKGEMRPRATRRVGNLRLISDRPEARKIVHRRLHNDDDDSGPNAA